MATTIDRMREVADGEKSISDKIRALDRLGASRREIADHLGRSYQHVRQVLVEDARRRGERGSPAGPRPIEASSRRVQEAGSEILAPVFRIRIDEYGTIALPSAAASSLMFQPGSMVIGRIEGGELILTSAGKAMEKAQAIVRALVPSTVSLADELIATRREQND